LAIPRRSCASLRISECGLRIDCGCRIAECGLKWEFGLRIISGLDQRPALVFQSAINPQSAIRSRQ
jgi:hypothetical protein